MSYIVENIEGFKCDKQQLSFLVKWYNYPKSKNTFEPLDNIVNTIPFREYINNLYSAIESDIELNNTILMQKLKDQIDEIHNTSKMSMMSMYQVGTYHKYAFKTYQVIYHMIQPNVDFSQRLEELFMQNHILQALKKQNKEIGEFCSSITRHELISLVVENIFDFSSPERFQYITENIFHDNIEGINDTNNFQLMDVVAFKIHKTTEGWTITTMADIAKGTIIMKCLGEVLTSTEAATRSDEKFFPTKLVHAGQSCTVDSSDYGNLSRFVNSKFPANSKIIQRDCNGDSLKEQQLLLVALRDIVEGEEITI